VKARCSRSERSEEEAVVATEARREPSPVVPLRLVCRIPIARLADNFVRRLTEPQRAKAPEEEVPKAQVLSRLFDSGKGGSQSPSTVEPKKKKSERERRVSGSSASSISTVSSRISGSDHSRHTKRSRKHSHDDEEQLEKKRRKDELHISKLASQVISNASRHVDCLILFCYKSVT